MVHRSMQLQKKKPFRRPRAYHIHLSHWRSHWRQSILRRQCVVTMSLSQELAATERLCERVSPIYFLKFAEIPLLPSNFVAMHVEIHFNFQNSFSSIARRSFIPLKRQSEKPPPWRTLNVTVTPFKMSPVCCDCLSKGKRKRHWVQMQNLWDHPVYEIR